MTPEEEQNAALRRICDTLVEAVAAAGPMGAPGGVIYSALCGVMNLQTFETIMGTLVQVGKLEKRGQCYHVKAA